MPIYLSLTIILYFVAIKMYIVHHWCLGSKFIEELAWERAERAGLKYPTAGTWDEKYVHYTQFLRLKQRNTLDQELVRLL